jgi:hypothetical protein
MDTNAYGSIKEDVGARIISTSCPATKKRLPSKVNIKGIF